MTSSDNDVPVVQSGAATGTTYNIGGFSTSFAFNKFNNGSAATSGNDSSITQTTTATPVPFEMSPTLGLLMVGGIWGLTVSVGVESLLRNNM